VEEREQARQRAAASFPLPATQEWGEGQGEGLPIPEFIWSGTLKSILLSLLAFVILATNALAADKAQLQVNLNSLGLRARNAAPVPVETRFKWEGTRILEGRLEMEFHEGNRVLGHYLSSELALTTGEQKFRMLLPAPLVPFSDSQVEVQMRFVTAANAVPLEPSALFLPTVTERSLVVALCAPISSLSQSGIERNLMVERFSPSVDRITQRLLTTSLLRLTPEDLPSQPLAYTPFDVVVLNSEAFKEASQRQLEALARWIRGGGSACVFIGSAGLQSQHIRFLNEMTDSVPGDQTFLAENNPELVPIGKEVQSLHSGLGRSVLVPDAAIPNLNTNTEACRKAATFLWKMRSRQAQAIISQGHWEEPTSSMDLNANSGPIPYSPDLRYQRGRTAEPVSYSVQSTTLGPALMNHLMPHTVRLIPFSALMVMLVLFIMMIGPVDYFVLGRLKVRRLTWVLFPATSLAFLVATVLMANHYLGLRDQHTSLFVVDLAKDGTALRWNRYELVFTARDKQLVSQMKDALWVPLSTSPRQLYDMYGGDPNYSDPYARRSRYASNPDESEAGPPSYEGALPVHFQARKPIRQWQPILNRTLSFEPPPVPLFKNWSAIEAAWPNRDKIRALLSEGTPFNGDLYTVQPNGGSTFSIGIVPQEILEEICFGGSSGFGFMSLVSQISPTGGANFEDLQVMDRGTQDAALVIVKRSGDDVIVYRRFFYGN
jgi:hypothetical protein